MWEEVEETFRSSVVRIVGEDARAWLDGLPALEAEICKRWQLEPGPELRGGLLALVRLVRRADGTDAVLKLAGPWDRPADEIASLRTWDGEPAPRLLEADVSRGALLLERITPGAKAEDAAADGGRAAPRPAARPGSVRACPRCRRSSAGGSTAPSRSGEPRRSGSRGPGGRSSASRRTHRNRVLVHGDFDERNLLVCDRRGLCAIDPLPFAGERRVRRGLLDPRKPPPRPPRPLRGAWPQRPAPIDAASATGAASSPCTAEPGRTIPTVSAVPAVSADFLSSRASPRRLGRLRVSAGLGPSAAQAASSPSAEALARCQVAQSHKLTKCTGAGTGTAASAGSPAEPTVPSAARRPVPSGSEPRAPGPAGSGRRECASGRKTSLTSGGNPKERSTRRRPSGPMCIAGTDLPELGERSHGIGHTPGHQPAEHLVPDLAQLGLSRALVEDDPTDVDVARTRNAQTLRALPDASADLRDRHRLVVEPPDRSEQSLVVSRRGRRHLSIIAGAV